MTRLNSASNFLDQNNPNWSEYQCKNGLIYIRDLEAAVVYHLVLKLEATLLLVF